MDLFLYCVIDLVIKFRKRRSRFKVQTDRTPCWSAFKILSMILTV